MECSVKVCTFVGFLLGVNLRMNPELVSPFKILPTKQTTCLMSVLVMAQKPCEAEGHVITQPTSGILKGSSFRLQMKGTGIKGVRQADRPCSTAFQSLNFTIT
jgi:hypothetical protein